jgi:hypothetical protein
MSNNATLWIVVALAAAAAVMLAVAAVTASRRRAHARSFELRQRFGPEYDRAVEALGSPARAERELAARTRRVEHIHLQDLSRADRSRFGASWGTVQAQFVDDPAGAAVNANELIKEVMRARGYPADDFDHRVADLSVDHADVVQHYRAARALTESSRNGQVNTEELRQALVHYRALFSDLLQETAAPPSLRREAHA